MVGVNSNYWSLWCSMHLLVSRSSTQLRCTVQSVVLEATVSSARTTRRFSILSLATWAEAAGATTETRSDKWHSTRIQQRNIVSETVRRVTTLLVND